jgi:hypothetical protein
MNRYGATNDQRETIEAKALLSEIIPFEEIEWVSQVREASPSGVARFAGDLTAGSLDIDASNSHQSALRKAGELIIELTPVGL